MNSLALGTIPFKSFIGEGEKQTTVDRTKTAVKRAVYTFAGRGYANRLSHAGSLVESPIIGDLERQFQELGDNIPRGYSIKVLREPKGLDLLYIADPADADQKLAVLGITRNGTSHLGAEYRVQHDKGVVVFDESGETSSSYFKKTLLPKASNLGRNEYNSAGFENLAPLKQASFFEDDSLFVAQTFVASDKLVRIWIEGVNALRADAGIELLTIPDDKTDRSVHKELERDVDTLVSNFARYKLYDHPGAAFKLTLNGQFYSRFEATLADFLLLPPRSSVIFLDELKKLLENQAEDGPKFKRDWGRLIVDNTGDLVLKFNRMRTHNLDDDFDP